MKIAFIGQKGIPATFGGVEQHVHELARRLTGRGHEVSVYVRDWYTPREIRQYDRIRLVHAPTVPTKHFDALAHSLTSSVHSVFQNYELVHYHAIGPTFFSWIPAIFQKKVVSTIHRLDWQSGKWGMAGRSFLKFTERTALYIPNATIVVSDHLRQYFEAKYRRRVSYIPNGVCFSEAAPPQTIATKYGLRGKDYILFLGRFVPEKKVDLLIEVFKAVKGDPGDSDLKLVLAGGSSASDEYAANLARQAEGRRDVVFTGYVTGREKAELFSNALLFVLPSYLEGHPIALLEAMSYGVPCLVSDISPHSEVIAHGVNGFLFRTNDSDHMAAQLKTVLQSSPSCLDTIVQEGKKYVREHFDWETVVDRVEEIYRSTV